jgi:hypothetical protein
VLATLQKIGHEQDFARTHAKNPLLGGNDHYVTGLGEDSAGYRLDEEGGFRETSTSPWALKCTVYLHVYGSRAR